MFWGCPALFGWALAGRLADRPRLHSSPRTRRGRQPVSPVAGSAAEGDFKRHRPVVGRHVVPETEAAADAGGSGEVGRDVGGVSWPKEA